MNVTKWRAFIVPLIVFVPFGAFLSSSSKKGKVRFYSAFSNRNHRIPVYLQKK